MGILKTNVELVLIHSKVRHCL